MRDGGKTSASAQTAAQGTAILDRFLESYYQLRPVNATFTGVHQHDDRLPDWSPEGLADAEEEMCDLRRKLTPELERYDITVGGGAPPSIEAADLTLADGFLEIQIAELGGQNFQRGNPALYTGEAVFSVLGLMLRNFAPAEQRAESVISRLRGIAPFLAGARHTLAGRGIAPSWKSRAQTECDGALALIGDGLTEWGREERLSEAAIRELDVAGSRAAPAIEEFRDWLRSVSDTDAPREGCGPEFFQLLLERGHWCRRSGRELLAETREQLAEQQAGLDELIQAAGATGWPEVQALLAERHPTEQEYLTAYEHGWDACRRTAVEQDLVSWPDLSLEYVPIPHWARRAAPSLYFLYYRSPAPYDDLPVTRYLVPTTADTAGATDRAGALQSNNDSVIKLNHVVHHGALGHHVQNSYAYRSASTIGRIAAVDCASRIGMFCGGSLAEGWACYAVDVMEEAGFLTDLESISAQHSRVRQLARAIVDIELHHHSMTQEEAGRFYVERSDMSPEAAQKEVTRNSMFPGTAVMYWLGTQAVHEARASATAGATLSLRQFHDRFLRYGSMPALLVAELLEAGVSA